MEKIFIRQQVCDRLRQSMLTESDLAAAIYRSDRIPDREQIGHFRCTCTVALRRPLDPETATLHEVEVRIKQTGEGLEVYAVEGLPVEV